MAKNSKHEVPNCKNGKAPKKTEVGQIDDVIGDFGRYQLLIFIFKIGIGVTSAFNNLGVTFFAPTSFVGYWCANDVQSFDNSTTNIRNSSFSPTGHGSTVRSYPVVDYQQVLTSFLSSDERNQKHIDLKYTTPTSIREECKFLSPVDKTFHRCSSYQYDKGIWLSTIIDEWDLVCDRSWLVSLTQSLYMSGFIISFLVFGYISDRFGRRRSLMLGALIETVSGIGCAFAGSITTFMFFRFLVGFGAAGRSSSAYLIMIEWCGPKWRMHISNLGSIGWAIGYSAMPWITLHYLHFRHMQIFACLYEIVFIIWLLRIPESPRWLLTHKRFDKAYEVLLMAARFNGLIKEEKVDFKDGSVVCKNIKMVREDEMFGTKKDTAKSDHIGELDEKQSNYFSRATEIEKRDDELCGEREGSLEPYTRDEFDRKIKHLIDTIQAKEFTKNEDRLSVLDLMKWKNLRRYAMILFFIWACNSFIYYGIVLRVGAFGGGNLFLTFTVAGLTELPSIAFTILAMKYLPRRTTNIVFFGIIGTLCALQAPLKYYDLHWLQQSTMLLAKLFNSCAFTSILYQTIELFPTSIRQTAYSSCSVAGRVGSILAPFVKELAQVTNQLVPPALYAGLSVLEIILVKPLPETKGSDLTDTLLEAEKFKGTDKLEPSSLEKAPSHPVLNVTLLNSAKNPFTDKDKSDIV